MEQHVNFKGFEPQTSVRKTIEDRRARLERKLKTFAADDVFLRVAVQEVPAHSLFTVSITLDVPGKTLAAKNETHDLAGGLREAFTEIERQFDSHKATLRGEHLWKRISKREELQHVNEEAAEVRQDNAQSFFTLVTPHLDKLSDFIRSVITTAEAQGDLAEGEVLTPEVLDATLLRAYDQFVKSPARSDTRSWLIRLATQELAAEIKRSKGERNRTVHVEEDIPETRPAEEVSTLGEEILYFYQPDEDLTVEDIVPDIETPDPEQEAESKELQACVRTSLADMPKELRRVLLLRYVQELPPAELAKVLGKKEPEVNSMLDNARQHLREKLVASGCILKG